MRRQSTKPLTPNLYFECMINSRIVRDHLNIFHSNYNQIRPHFFHYSYSIFSDLLFTKNIDYFND
jgi:hypothetical protein